MRVDDVAPSTHSRGDVDRVHDRRADDDPCEITHTPFDAEQHRATGAVGVVGRGRFEQPRHHDLRGLTRLRRRVEHARTRARRATRSAPSRVFSATLPVKPSVTIDVDGVDAA